MKKVMLLGAAMILCVVLLAACGDGSAEWDPDPSVSESEMHLETRNDGLSIECGEGGNTLSWLADESAESYVIYRAKSRFGQYEKLAECGSSELSYTDSEPSVDCCYKVVGLSADGEEMDLYDPMSQSIALFGDNVLIFSPDDDPALVAQAVSRVNRKQVDAQFGAGRYALMFKPGVYDSSIKVNVGFYTLVAGLGASPTDVVIDNLNCLARWLDNSGNNNNATCNFWRGVENISVNSDVVWAVSQATSMRRVFINGSLALHDNNGWSSGGFLSDSFIAGTVDSGSQQQWLSRNDDWSEWTGQNWNMVFLGLEDGAAPEGTWPETKFTTVEKTPAVCEKPYLVFDEKDGYMVCVPGMRKDSTGVSWQKGGADDRMLSIDEFYVARADYDTSYSINAALASGKNILFTPGIYALSTAIKVTRADTVILGLGLATLRPEKGGSAMLVSDVDGVRIAGLLFDAGKRHSENLLIIGKRKTNNDHSDNPIILSDLYFRVGGMFTFDTSVDCCAVINSNDVIGDNFWVWRADHGDGVAWDTNVTKNGIIVNGDNITFYSLMVEHFHEYQTIWNGENGRTYFYQCETPYDVPDQSEWMSNGGTVEGYASYKISDDVKKHEAWGLGIYTYHRDAVVTLTRAMEIPDAPGVRIHNCCAVMITGNPGIAHVINDAGDPATTGVTRSIIVEYCNGEFSVD